MGVLGCCGKFSAFIALAIAVFIGYLNTFQHPVGGLFVTVFKLQGIGKPGTEPVPDDFAPMPRPAGEIFYDLPGGDKMPGNGIGMCCRPSAYDPISVRRTILWYLLHGGRHIDTASVYMNHREVGLGIKDAMARGVPRSEIFLTTKVWPDNFGYDASIARTREMVKELGVEYLDLVLIHAPVVLRASVVAKFFYNKVVGGSGVKFGSDPETAQLRIDTWKGLSAVKQEGLVRNVGVSNFNIQHMKQLQALNLAPIAANQMQFHPWAPDWMKEIKQYCDDSSIVVTGYFSLGGMDNKAKAMEAVSEVAQAHGRRPAQILLRWSLQKNVSIIPGTGNHKHMGDNLGTYEFSLSDADMAKLDGMASLPVSQDFMFFEF